MRKRNECLLLAVVLFLGIRVFINERNAHVVSKVPQRDITTILAKDHFSEEDYHILLLQTGLGKTAVDDLRQKNDCFLEDMLEFQNQYFSPVHYRREFMFPTAREERLVYENGNPRTIKFAPVRDGDIIITRATHTMLWRHGHAAIVTDAQQEETLESVMLGQESSFQTLDKWRGYPSILILRAKNETVGRKAAEYAKEHLAAVDYNPFVGIKKKDKHNEELIDSTQCAHLVWQAYQAVGVNTDANDGWLVLPRDIANSTELEIVQIYGFLPRNPLW